jgi:hypothetical protein
LLIRHGDDWPLGFANANEQKVTVALERERSGRR